MRKSKHTKKIILNAWLLTWEGTTGPAVNSERKIIAIIDARRSESFVEGLIDVLYSRFVDSAYDMAFMANKRKQREAHYRHLNTYPGRILYGRRPSIYARRVNTLTIQWDEDTGEEQLSWVEPAIYGNAKTGAGVREIVPATSHKHSRSYGVLSHDLYEGEA